MFKLILILPNSAPTDVTIHVILISKLNIIDIDYRSTCCHFILSCSSLSSVTQPQSLLPIDIQRLILLSVINIAHSESHSAKLHNVILLQPDSISTIRGTPTACSVSGQLTIPMIVFDDEPQFLFWILIHMCHINFPLMINPVTTFIKD
jgi:hypothetical protein